MKVGLSLINGAEFSRVMNAVAAGTTTQNSSGVKNDNGEGVIFGVLLGAVVDAAGGTLKLQHSNDDAATDPYVDVAGTSLAIPDTADNRLLLIEHIRPQRLWTRVVVVRGAQNITIDGIWAAKTGLRREPAVQPASVSASKVVIEQDSGTP
jgi:hypothetical protein